MPFKDNSFDAVVSSMILGMVPDQKKALCEMRRVLRPDGILALSTYAPKDYCEHTKASIITVLKNILFSLNMLVYRLEFWPQYEKGIKRIMKQAGFVDVYAHRLTWQDDLGTSEKAYDFVASTSSMWWYGNYKPEKISKIACKVRETYANMKITRITQDVTFAYGRKS